MSYPTFVASTTSLRRPRNASASCRSARPFPYASAASKNVTPCASSARRSIATASASVLSPHQPVDSVHVPKPTSETVRSVLGKVRYLIVLRFDGSTVHVSEQERRRRGQVGVPAGHRRTVRPSNGALQRAGCFSRKVRDHHIRSRAPDP